jgi:hypothetical protein
LAEAAQIVEAELQPQLMPQFRRNNFRPPDTPARIRAFSWSFVSLRGEKHERFSGTISPCETSIML